MLGLKPQKNREEELNYWQSISDVMTALLVIILLIMMLFILYMTRVPETEGIDEEDHLTDYLSGGVDDDYGRLYDSIYWVRNPDDGNGYDGGWHGGAGDGSGYGTGDGRGDNEGDYEFPEPGIGDYEGTEKAAVFVKVVDGETGLTIKKEGIDFQLYNERRGLTRLFDYYPVRVAHNVFGTTETGVFYLPEKIGLGEYHLTELSVPYGYDRAGNVSFSVLESHDWDDPVNVTVEIFPCKNTISIQNVEKGTRDRLSFGSYQVVAADDIVTADGTVRYTKGQVVDEITCDENGLGESIELYIGLYELVQTSAPKYYVFMDETRPIFLARKGETDQKIRTVIELERTQLAVDVRDELYQSRAVGNAVFELKRADGSVAIARAEANAQGNILLNTLDKNTGYILRQIETRDGYRVSDESVEFTVSEDGRIEGETRRDATLYNRMIRVKISLRDILTGKEICDKNVALFTQDQKLLNTWSTTAVPEEIEGIQPGEYRLVVGGREDSAKTISVEDRKEVQTFEITIWAYESIMLVTGGCIVFAVIFIALTIIVRHKKKANKE